MLRVSVVIPAYNIEEYIEKCLNSILAQTLQNIEIVVVDDGSTDNTPAILDEYANRNSAIRVIRQKNGGVTSARLRGRCRGFWRMDRLCRWGCFY